MGGPLSSVQWDMHTGGVVKVRGVLQYQSFFYRCFDGDSPLAGLSGHAYECFQMQQLYTLARPFAAEGAKHFMCVDELGKGTEDLSASALCCSALQLFGSVRPCCMTLATLQTWLASRCGRGGACQRHGLLVRCGVLVCCITCGMYSA